MIKKKKRQKDKQWSTKHYTQNKRQGNTNTTKTGGGEGGMVNSDVAEG
jgi:hypothetical protein